MPLSEDTCSEAAFVRTKIKCNNVKACVRHIVLFYICSIQFLFSGKEHNSALLLLLQRQTGCNCVYCYVMFVVVVVAAVFNTIKLFNLQIIMYTFAHKQIVDAEM